MPGVVGGAPAGIAVGVFRLVPRGGGVRRWRGPGRSQLGRRGRLGRAVEAEHGAAVVGEVELVLAASDVDPVREHEVGADQHVDVAQLDRADPEPGVLDLLVAELEAVDRRDPGFDRAAAETVGKARRRHARRVVMDAGAARRAQGEHRGGRPAVELHLDGEAVHLGRADDGGGAAPRLVQLDDGIGRAGPVPVGQGLAFATVGLEHPDHAVGEVDLGVGDHQEVAPQDPVDGRSELGPPRPGTGYGGRGRPAG